MIAAIIERCAGIDVGKKFIAVCVMTGPADGEARSETRIFGTTVAELKQARSWITEEQCTHVMLESTGSYWKPIFNILGRPGESGTGQPARSESTQRPQDRSERRLVAGAPAATRHGDAQLYPATTAARAAGPDPSSTETDAGGECGE